MSHQVRQKALSEEINRSEFSAGNRELGRPELVPIGEAFSGLDAGPLRTFPWKRWKSPLFTKDQGATLYRSRGYFIQWVTRLNGISQEDIRRRNNELR